jgi:two-component system, OmpR family, response regulator
MKETPMSTSVQMPINMLYVDDDDRMRAMVENACDVSDYTVTAVPLGDEARVLARRESFDLILVDVVMPGLDGPATVALRRTEEREGSTPMALMDAHRPVAEVNWLRARDVVGVLAKPFDRRTLPVLLRSLADEARHSAQRH